MQSNKTMSLAIIIINILGILCLIYFAILYITHDTFIANPDAMLPSENWDRSGMSLTIGLIPLLIANSLAFMKIPKEKSKLPIRFLCFAPSLICLLLVLSYWIIS